MDSHNNSHNSRRPSNKRTSIASNKTPLTTINWHLTPVYTPISSPPLFNNTDLTIPEYLAQSVQPKTPPTEHGATNRRPAVGHSEVSTAAREPAPPTKPANEQQTSTVVVKTRQMSLQVSSIAERLPDIPSSPSVSATTKRVSSAEDLSCKSSQSPAELGESRGPKDIRKKSAPGLIKDCETGVSNHMIEPKKSAVVNPVPAVNQLSTPTSSSQDIHSFVFSDRKVVVLQTPPEQQIRKESIKMMERKRLPPKVSQATLEPEGHPKPKNETTTAPDCSGNRPR